MPSRRTPPDAAPQRPDFDPALEAVATGWLSQRRGKAVRGGPPDLSRLINGLIPPEARKGGFGVKDLQRNWTEIVGEKLASISAPDAIKGETLVLKVAAAAAPLLTMRSAEIIGLVRLAGANKIKRLSMVRSSIKTPGAAASLRKPPPMDAAAQRELDQQLAKVEQPALKAALKRLAEAVSDKA